MLQGLDSDRKLASHPPHLLPLTPPISPHRALLHYRGDICDVDFMEEVFERERPTHVCHLAARAGVRPSIIDPYIYVHSNIEGIAIDSRRDSNNVDVIYSC